MVDHVKPHGQHPVAGGGFADIWHGKLEDLERPVCLKVLRLIIEPDKEIRQKIRKQFCNEALLWRQLKHPNILPLLGVNTDLFSPSFCLISPWMENGNIISYLKQNTAHNRYKVLLEIAAGLSYLHSRNPPIIHGDIRGANILVTDDLHCCLADFGLALVNADSQSWSTTTTVKGAIRWMAPELIINPKGKTVELIPLNQTSRDIYAFGCSIVEILTLRLPFHDQKTDAQVLFSLIKGERPARPENTWCSDMLWDLTTRCWTECAADRPHASEVYEVLRTCHYGERR
ncbi:kinase-like protein, partial [Gymnopus androsaceus JB14]